MERLKGHAELQELLGAYALDAVEPEEAELLEHHIQVCPRCRDELAQHREVAALLGYAGASAPEGVWDRIIASLEEPPPALQLTRLTAQPPRPAPGPTISGPQTPPPIHALAHGGPDAAVVPIGRRRRRTIEMRFLVAAAAAAMVVAGLGIAVGRLGRHDVPPVTSQLASPGEVYRAVSADPSARKISLTSADNLYQVAAVITPDGSTHVGPGNLPVLPANETYQVWGIVDGQRISLGVVGTNPTFASFTTPSKVGVLAITIEDQGGVVTSTKTPVLTGAVS